MNATTATTHTANMCAILRGFLHTASSLMTFVCVYVRLLDARERQMVCFCVKPAGKMGAEKNEFQRTSADTERTNRMTFIFPLCAFFVFWCSATVHATLQYDWPVHLYILPK